ncbi:hypothetical protein PFISCL1PPCAC_11375, partial [Pristionchus fissidentatus]
AGQSLAPTEAAAKDRPLLVRSQKPKKERNKMKKEKTQEKKVNEGCGGATRSNELNTRRQPVNGAEKEKRGSRKEQARNTTLVASQSVRPQQVKKSDEKATVKRRDERRNRQKKKKSEGNPIGGGEEKKDAGTAKGCDVESAKQKKKEKKKKKKQSDEVDIFIPVETEKATVSAEITDNHNGFDISLRKAGECFKIKKSAIFNPAHPWEKSFNPKRPRTPTTKKLTMRPPDCDAPPFRYDLDSLIRLPKENTVHSTVTLKQVAAFRTKTAEKALSSVKNKEQRGMKTLLDKMATLSTSDESMIYRHTGVLKNKMYILEAIHFELFMPDRFDLRFIALPFSSLPLLTLEGEYFKVSSVNLFSTNSFLISLGMTDYPVVWMVERAKKMYFEPVERNGLAYIVNHSREYDGEIGVTSVADREFLMPASLFSSDELRVVESIVTVAMRNTSGAHLYPVESPIRPKPTPPKHPLGGRNQKTTTEPVRNPAVPYVQRVKELRTSSQRMGKVMAAVRALSEEDANRIDD